MKNLIMKPNKGILIVSFFLLLLFSLTAPGCAKVIPTEQVVSDGSQRANTELTIYNNNQAFVKEVRKVPLDKGNGTLRFEEVSKQLNPETAFIEIINFKDDFSIYEQSYHRDLINPQRLLEKFVGEEIELLVSNEYQDRNDIVTAKLLSTQGPVYSINGKVHIGHPGSPILPYLPSDSLIFPTLEWTYTSLKKRDYEIRLSYLTSGLSWSANYNLQMNRDESEAVMQGWVTVRNQSGTDFIDTDLSLVAGQPNRVGPVHHAGAPRMAKMMVMADATESSAFQESSLSEYHLFSLKRPVSIENLESKQILYLETEKLKIEKQHIIEGGHGYYSVHRVRQDQPFTPVNTFVKFKNSESDGLGNPLAQGVVRIFQQDEKERLQFIGEDHIRHTPVDEDVKLRLGKSFDLVYQRTQTDYRKITSKMHETEWEVRIRNHKKKSAMVKVIEGVGANWKVLRSSHAHNKKNAFAMEFNVDVPAGKEVVLKFRVQVGH